MSPSGIEKKIPETVGNLELPAYKKIMEDPFLVQAARTLLEAGYSDVRVARAMQLISNKMKANQEGNNHAR